MHCELEKLFGFQNNFKTALTNYKKAAVYKTNILIHRLDN